MNDNSPMTLIGVGTAGCLIARGVSRAFGEGLRYLMIDTDAATGNSDEPFLLIGGDRLSGRGAGGDMVAARLAAEESIKTIDEHLTGVRLAIVVTALGSGTGSGATLEAITHLSELGIPVVVFATMPFDFEGEDRKRNADNALTMIEDSANATFALPLDKLVSGEDNMNEALRRAIDTVATAITLFWRLVEKPGYIRLDTERIRHLVTSAGRARFATVSAQGPSRATDALDQLVRAEILADGAVPVRSILCGVLAGDDLRLSEIGKIADGIRQAFGPQTAFDLGTVNDETTFSGRLSVVVMLFEANANAKEVSAPASVLGHRKPKKGKGSLGVGPIGRGRFNNAEATIWNGEDLDIPTFVRRNIHLDF